MWRAVHPGHTEARRIPDQDGGASVTIGFWPPLKDVELRAEMRSLGVALKAPVADADRVAVAKREYALFREYARWGCRGWTGGNEMPAAVVADVELDGRKFKALSDESIDVLYTNGLLPAVALAAYGFNVTSLEEKKRPESPSHSDTGSSEEPTPVVDVIPLDDPKTTASKSP